MVKQAVFIVGVTAGVLLADWTYLYYRYGYHHRRQEG